MLEDCEIGPVVRVSTIVTALGVAVTVVTCYCKSKRLPARAIDRGKDIATAHILGKENMLEHIKRIREGLT